MLSELYGSTWVFVHGTEPSDEIIRFANSLDAQRMNRVIAYCSEQVSKGNKFAPNLIELIVFAETPSDTEFYLIMQRVKANKPEDRIEQYLAETIRFNLKRQAADHEMSYFKSQYRNAQALSKIGKLKTSEDEILALPKHSVKNLNDINRERFDGQLNPRIARILESKK